jgi:phosphopantothenoylcysteine decarboxylase/phosphopantothenate--cysteine ligase
MRPGSELPATQILVAAAAVADYRPPDPAPRKIKKAGPSLQLQLERAPDILAAVTAGPMRPRMVVGFAAETEQVEAHARGKLTAKRLDMIVANEVGEGLAFDTDDNALLLLWPGGSRKIARGAKRVIAHELVAAIAERFDRQPAAGDGSRAASPVANTPAAIPSTTAEHRRARG